MKKSMGRANTSFRAMLGTGLGIGLIFTIVVFLAVRSELDGRYGTEVATVLIAGILGGSLVRRLARENRVAIVLVLLVIAETILLKQGPQPWPGLWPILVPGNAIGVLVGAAIRTGVRQSRPKPRDVWVVNGIGDPRSDSAKAKALDALSSWDAGGFRPSCSAGMSSGLRESGRSGVFPALTEHRRSSFPISMVRDQR